MNKRPIVAASLLSGDFANFADSAKLVKESGAEWLHLDVMDGMFVPPITFGSQAVAALRDRSDLFFDAHLMTERPWEKVADFAAAGTDALTFHIETCAHAHRTVSLIKEAGMEAGISLTPSTPVYAVEELLPYVDLVLVMSVNPGYGGQRFITTSVSKVEKLNELRQRGGYRYRISVDGGVNNETAPGLIRAGIDVLVAGSYLFGRADMASRVALLQGL